jgi:hypothetical protein
MLDIRMVTAEAEHKNAKDRLRLFIVVVVCLVALCGWLANFLRG